MILTITPNAALDRTLVVHGYGDGGVFRPERAIVAPGGKGVNVARAVRILGGDACCCGFIAGHIGALMASLIVQEGLRSCWTQLPEGETRTCTIVVDPACERTTVVIDSGVRTTLSDWKRLRADILNAAEDADAICLCGSLTPGTPPEAVAALLAELQELHKPIWVDSSGVGLQTAAALTGVHLKVNTDEAGELLGVAIFDPAAAGDAALSLARRRDAFAAITLGKDGAVISDSEGVWYAQPPSITVKSAVGSGDSFLAGLLVRLTQGAPAAEALRWGAAAGTANALSIGGGSFSMADFERILSNTTIINQKTS
jgi:1-phosphofructokinase family hexose kinase